MSITRPLLERGVRSVPQSGHALDYVSRDDDDRLSRPRGPWGGGIWWAGTVVIALLAAVIVRTYAVQSFVIPSSSMEPTLHGCAGCQDDRVLVDKLFYRFGSLHRGDVVVLHRPAAEIDTLEPYLIKRIIGLSGETVSAQDGVVIIDNRILTEPYVNPQCGGTASFGPVTVPTGQVFVLGDNRCNSSDSRVFGPITKTSIIGRAFLRVWPVGRLHRL
ncbi:MAG: lepB [Pseudonocardiales bacterium]|nr:lepB [Pseudonocardiales bacterium]